MTADEGDALVVDSGGDGEKVHETEAAKAVCGEDETSAREDDGTMLAQHNHQRISSSQPSASRIETVTTSYTTTVDGKPAVIHTTTTTTTITITETCEPVPPETANDPPEPQPPATTTPPSQDLPSYDSIFTVTPPSDETTRYHRKSIAEDDQSLSVRSSMRSHSPARSLSEFSRPFTALFDAASILPPVFGGEDITDEERREEGRAVDAENPEGDGNGLKEYLELYKEAVGAVVGLIGVPEALQAKIAKVSSIRSKHSKISSEVNELQKKRLKDAQDVTEIESLSFRSLKARVTGRIRQAKIEELTELEVTTDQLVTLSMESTRIEEELEREETELSVLRDKEVELVRSRKDLVQYLNLAFESIYNATDHTLQNDLDRTKNIIVQHDNHLKQIVQARQLLFTAADHLRKAQMSLRRFLELNARNLVAGRISEWPGAAGIHLKDAKACLIEMGFTLCEVPVPAGSERVDFMMERIISHSTIPTLPPPPNFNRPVAQSTIETLLRCRNDTDISKAKADAALEWLFNSIVHIGRVRDRFRPILLENRKSLVMHRILEFEVLAGENEAAFDGGDLRVETNSASIVSGGGGGISSPVALSDNPVAEAAAASRMNALRPSSGLNALGGGGSNPSGSGGGFWRRTFSSHHTTDVLSTSPVSSPTTWPRPFTSSIASSSTIDRNASTVSRESNSSSTPSSPATTGPIRFDTLSSVGSGSSIDTGVGKVPLDPLSLLPDGGIVEDVAVGGALEILELPQEIAKDMDWDVRFAFV
ncbi:hypothetical protein HDU67_003045 [Dinochytrium kinnereticum]|nr:hypothetical protein HDU67_003045 [Dinochytrium kinnereticum]